MSDANWEYKKKCEEAAKELFDEMLDLIREGKDLPDLHDKVFQRCDDVVPIYTKDLYDLVEYLDEQWDEVDRTTFDKAITQSCYYKATEYLGAEFRALGGVTTLEEIATAGAELRDALHADDPVQAFEDMSLIYADQLAILYPDGIEGMKPTRSGPKMK